jgi:hypothetical protein
LGKFQLHMCSQQQIIHSFSCKTFWVSRNFFHNIIFFLVIFVRDSDCDNWFLVVFFFWRIGWIDWSWNSVVIH